MRSYLKILIATVLIGIGCFAGTRIVKADVPLDQSADKGFTYSITGEAPNAAFTITADNEGTEILLASGNLDATGNYPETTIDGEGLSLPDTAKELPVKVLIGGEQKGPNDFKVKVYHLDLSYPNTLTCSLNSSNIKSSFKDLEYKDVNIEASDYPNYIKSQIIDGVENLVNSRSLTMNLQSSKKYEFTVASQSVEISIQDDVSDPNIKRAILKWNSENDKGLANPYYFYFKPKIISHTTDYAGASISGITETNAIISTTGVGRGALRVFISKENLGENPTDQQLKEKAYPKDPDYWEKQFDFGGAVSNVSITITGNNSINVEEAFPYDALVLIDGVVAADQNVTWSVSPATNASLNPVGPTTEGTLLTANTTGTLTLTATSETYNKSQTKTISVQKKGSKTVDSVTVDQVNDDDEILVNTKSLQLRATVSYSDGSEDKKVTRWYLDPDDGSSDIATLTNDGKLTLKSSAEDGDTVTVYAVASGVESLGYTMSVVDRIVVEGLYFKSADTTNEVYITKDAGASGHVLDLNWKQGVTSEDHPNASVYKIEYVLETGKDVGTFSGGKFTPKSYKSSGNNSATYIPRVFYSKDATDYVDMDENAVTITVVEDWTSKLSESGGTSSSTSSDYHIGFKLENDEVYTGWDPSKNLESITGYKVEVIYNDKVVAGKTFTSIETDSDKTNKVTKKELEDLLKEASDQLSGDSPEVTFRISPYGSNQAGTSDKVTNTDAGKTIKRTVYKDGSTYSLDKSSSSSSMKSSSGLMSGSGSDYDKVPKTGEGNTRLLIIMIAVISATIAGSILLSNLPVRSKSGADESVDEKDVFHKKD